MKMNLRLLDCNDLVSKAETRDQNGQHLRNGVKGVWGKMVAEEGLEPPTRGL